MAQTNAMIIMQLQAEMGIDEPLHTFAHWKSLGRKVKRGEHGIETALWKYRSRKKETDEGEEVEEGRCYMCKAFLFKESQTEEIKEDLKK